MGRATPQRLLDEKQVCQITSLDRVTIFRLEREREFPRRIKIAKRRVAWIASEIEQWIAKLARSSRVKLTGGGSGSCA